MQRPPHTLWDVIRLIRRLSVYHTHGMAHFALRRFKNQEIINNLIFIITHYNLVVFTYF